VPRCELPQRLAASPEVWIFTVYPIRCHYILRISVGDPMSESAILCPSWRCEAGASLIGIILPNGSVAFSKDRIVVDDAFVEIARQGRSPEKRFRFSSTCKRAACVQWADGKCSISEIIVRDHQERHPDSNEPFVLPECSIRPHCRWHLQSGDEACRACPEVITDQSSERAASAGLSG
jgi:hypothetical protein